MKNSIFNAVCKTRYLALLVVLIFTCGNAWGADVTGTINFGSASGSLNINSASVSGDDDLENSWTVTTVGTTSFTPNAAYAQVGAKKSPATSITFTTTLPSAQTIKSMSAKFGGFSGTAGTVTLKVGDNSIGTGSLNETSDVTVSSTDGTKSGTVLTVTVTGISKGVKCYYISYTYSKGGGGTCSTPTFSPAAGTYCGSQTVTISSSTSGSTIYYTTDGTNPTTSSSHGTAGAASATVEVSSSKTVKAIVVKDGMSNSSTGSAAYTINTPLTTMDAIYSAATTAGSTPTTKCITFDNWVVSGASSNGRNVYVTDGSKGFIIYGNSDTGFRQGDILSGTVSCNIQLFNQSAELTDLTTSTTGLTVTKGGSVTPVVKNASEIASLTGAYTGIVITTTGEVETCNSNKQCINGAQLYNQLYTYDAVTTGNTYTATGVYLQYGGTHEILPLSNLVEVSYTITAVSNNNSYGTVSLTGNVITASPVSGYRVSTTTAYEVTVGTATVTDNGDNTFTVTPSSDCTVRINFEAIPKYTVTLKDNDETLTQASAGAAVTLPSRTGCDGYTFAGWTKTWTSPQSSWTTTAPTIIPAGSYTPEGNENLYPVYTKEEGEGGGSATLTKLGSTYVPTAGDNLVIVEPNGSYALYQETSGTYVAYWNFSNSAATVGADDKNYVTLESDGDDGWYLGDAINGYVYNGSSNNLIVDTDNHTSFSITWNSTGFNIVGNSRWLSCRTDVQTPNTNKYRMGGAASGSASGDALFDLYKYVAGGGSTTYYISVPNCCTDWSTPTVSYSSSLAIGATANVSISSGTTHGALTYESSNEDILTVESDGTITAVGAGTAHIIATWAGDATYCEKSANSNDITVSGIEITGTLPVNFGQVYQNAVIGDKTLSVTGLGLTSAIIPSLPSGSPFSVSPASFAQDCSGATLTISASTATIGEYSHTLTLTSGSFTATATINMNVIAMPSCTFVDNLHNLAVDKNGVSLSNYDLTAAAGTSVVFPVLANQEKGVSTCDEQHYVFVGWTTSDDNDHPENHLVTSHNLENGDDITYYAVWADGVAGVSYTKLTSSTFKTSPTKYVIGADDGEGTDLFFYSCEKTDQNNSWGYVSSDPSTDAPIQFTLSGTASELVATSTEATARYLNPASGKQFFGMSATSKTVVLGESGTIESTADTYNNLRYNYNSGSGGLRWYTGTNTGTAAYFYEVVAGNTPSYRTSCCANKVPAPTVTATKTSTTITLSWNDLSGSGATGYEVSWNSGAWTSTSGSRTYTASGLTPNTSYSWQVRATYTDPKCGADIASGSTTTNQVYHVTYAKGDESANCNATGSTTDATAYEAGAAVTLQANGFTLHGYDFNVWTTDDPDVTISSNQFTMPDHDVVITASWTAKVDKYFDRMHDQTDALHGGIEETESGPNEGKYYIPQEGCNYTIPTASDSKTGDACQTSHYKLRGWIAASYMKGYPNNMTGEIGTGNESHIFEPTGTKTATGATYYAIWAEVVE